MASVFSFCQTVYLMRVFEQLSTFLQIPLRGCLRSRQCDFRSPLAPLEKGGTGIKVPLLKGNLGGSVLFQRVV